MNDSRSGFGSLHMPRSRGAVSGLLLIILGVWGALIPFIGPYFHFAYTPDQAWAWSTARGLAGGVPRSHHRGGRLFAAGLRESRHRDVRRLVGRHRRRLVRRRSHAGIAYAARGYRSPDRCDGCQTRGDRDQLLLRPGHTDRLPRRSGLGASVGPNGARCRIRAGSRAPGAADTSGAFAAPAAPTEVLTRPPQTHRRESKGGLFRRHRASVAGN